MIEIENSRIIIEALEPRLKHFEEMLSERLDSSDLVGTDVNICEYNNDTYLIDSEIRKIKRILKEHYEFIRDNFDKTSLDKEIKLFLSRRYSASKITKKGVLTVPTSLGHKYISYEIIEKKGNNAYIYAEL